VLIKLNTYLWAKMPGDEQFLADTPPTKTAEVFSHGFYTPGDEA
jgi:hypothetical protein